MNLLYYLFRDWKMMPGDYYSRPAGEKMIIRAFFSRFAEELKNNGT